MNEETIIIPLKEYNELKENSLFLSLLEANGVRNWDQYGAALYELRRALKEES